MSGSDSSSKVKNSVEHTRNNPQVTSARVRTSRLTTRNHVRPISSHFPSESFFLAFLFTLVVLLVPSLFYHISRQVSYDRESSNTTSESSKLQENEPSPQNVLRGFLIFMLSYIPRLSVILSYFYSSIGGIAYPVLLITSFLTSLFRPLLISLQILLQSFIIIPVKAFLVIADFLYPIYVFIGVSCLMGALVGFFAKYTVILFRTLV